MGHQPTIATARLVLRPFRLADAAAVQRPAGARETAATSNRASGHVMEKLGMTFEGCRRQHVLKWDQYQDLAIYGLLREEFPARP